MESGGEAGVNEYLLVDSLIHFLFSFWFALFNKHVWRGGSGF